MGRTPLLLLFLILLFLSIPASVSAIFGSTPAFVDGHEEIPKGPLKVFVACAFHGREWATETLCRAWEDEVKRIASPWVEWKFIHNVNPMGCKIARDSYNAGCHRGNSRGVDLNRNFPPIKRCPNGNEPSMPGWVTRLSRDAEEYPGEFPFSESESSNMGHELRRFAPDLALFVHTGAEAIILPFDACFEPVPSELTNAQYSVAHHIGKAVGIKKKDIGTGTTKLGYRSVGTAMDWACAEMDVPLAFTLETYRVPAECPEAKRLRSMATANMTHQDCKQVFVPHDSHCTGVDLKGYAMRWLPLVDAITQLASDESNRVILSRWIKKDLVMKQ